MHPRQKLVLSIAHCERMGFSEDSTSSEQLALGVFINRYSAFQVSEKSGTYFNGLGHRLPGFNCVFFVFFLNFCGIVLNDGQQHNKNLRHTFLNTTKISIFVAKFTLNKDKLEN